MKNKISKLILCGVMFAFASCNLDRYPETSIGEDDFYSSATEVEYGLIGAYAYVMDAYEDLWQITELRSDNSQAVNGGIGGSNAYVSYALMDYSIFYETDDIVTDCFDNLYVLISRCNVVLEYVDIISDEDERNKIKGEALALRAMAHFDLARLWGEVWYVDSSISGQEALAMSKTSQAEIFDNIVTDLEWVVSSAGLPTPAEQASGEIGRLNDYAVRTLLAKVYLTLQEYSSVKTVLSPVVNYYGTTDLVAYDQIFDINNEMNDEMLFAVRYTSGNVGLGSPYTNYFGPSQYTTFAGGTCYGRNAPTDDLVRAFGNEYEWEYTYSESTGTVTGIVSVMEDTIEYSEDLRSAVCLDFFSAGRAWYNYKYFDWTCTTVYDADKDFPLIRYADALLMYAEALNRTGSTSEAATYVNAIRNRAGLSDLVGVTTEDDMHTAILNERRLEFAFENQRFFDMLREGDAYFMSVNNAVFAADETYENILLESYLPVDVTSDKILLPIPFTTASLY